MIYTAIIMNFYNSVDPLTTMCLGVCEIPPNLKNLEYPIQIINWPLYDTKLQLIIRHELLISEESGLQLH